MDKLVYIAATGARQTMLAQTKVANNLANVKTTGFRADLNQFRSMQAFGEGHASRVFAMSERPGYRFDSGAIQTTGNDLDAAIKGDGWFAVLDTQGNEAYTRRGDLKVNANGLLTNGANQIVLGNGGPISLPPFEKLDISGDGTISIRPKGSPANQSVVLDRLKLVKPDNSELMKNQEGDFVNKEGQPFQADGTVTIAMKALESSNVNSIEELTDMISLSRQFEIQVKMLKTAEDNDRSLERLLQLS